MAPLERKLAPREMVVGKWRSAGCRQGAQRGQQGSGPVSHNFIANGMSARTWNATRAAARSKEVAGGPCILH